MTKRDKTLLLFLAAFIIAVGFLALVIVPTIGRIKELNVQIIDQQSHKEKMTDKLIKLSGLQAQYEKEQERYEAVTKDFYPLQKSQEIDRMLTDMALSSGLLVRELNIKMPQEESEFVPYQGAETGLLNKDAKEEASIQNKTFDEAGDETAPDADTSTQVYEARVMIIVKGTEEQRSQFIDLLCSYPALHITNYQTTASTDNSQPDALKLGLALYMCDKEGVNGIE